MPFGFAKLRTPEQAERWTRLILAALTQLLFARTLVADHRLPWQPALPAPRSHPAESAGVSGIYYPATAPRPTGPKHTDPALDGTKAPDPHPQPDIPPSNAGQHSEKAQATSTGS